MAARRAALALLCLCVAAPAFAARLALVIGNDSYRNVTTLRNARTDASTMAQTLERVGFKTTLAHDVDDRGLRAAIRAFKARVGEGDDVVFFYAGHGVQLGATNYLLPIDIRGDSEDQVKDDALPLQRVLDDLGERKVRFSLVIVDACRDNPFRGHGRALGGRGLAPTMAATGQMIIYSAGSGQQALDRLSGSDTDPNGLFTRIFIKEMERSGQSVDRVVRSVRDEVVRLARSVGHEQVPALYDQSLGDFFFRQVGAVPPAPAAPSSATTSAAPDRPTAVVVPTLAVARFVGDDLLEAPLRRVVGNDLERSGRFRQLDASDVVMDDKQRPDFVALRTRGVNLAVGGSFASLEDGRIAFRFRVWDIASQTSLGGLEFRFQSDTRSLRGVAHHIADWLQLKLTGVPGSFSKRVAKVTSMVGRYTLNISDSDGENVQMALSSLKPIGLPTWSSQQTHLSYVSFEKGQPAFFTHDLAAGVRRINLAVNARLLVDCGAEIAAFQNGGFSEDWLRDDWSKGSTKSCPAALAATLPTN